MIFNEAITILRKTLLLITASAQKHCPWQWHTIY